MPPAPRRDIPTVARAIAASATFQSSVLALIVVNAAVMGLQTSTSIDAAWGGALDAACSITQAAFVLEIAIRLLAFFPRPARFFREGWNVFDFSVVALSLLPVSGSLATVARLARILRVTRLVSALPDLRLIIGTMLRSIPSMGHVMLLLGLLLYFYGLIGVQLFASADPERWGHLGRALLTLFQVLTLEGWVEMQEAVRPTVPLAWLYFSSFVLVAVFVVVNLFVAVVINNLQTVKAEQAHAAASGRDDELLARVSDLRTRLGDLEDALRRSGRQPDGRNDRG